MTDRAAEQLIPCPAPKGIDDGAASDFAPVAPGDHGPQRLFQQAELRLLPADGIQASRREFSSLGTGFTAIVREPQQLRNLIQTEAELARPPDARRTAGGLAQLKAGGGAPVVRMTCGLIRASYGGALGLFECLDRAIVEDVADVPAIRSEVEAVLSELVHALESKRC